MKRTALLLAGLGVALAGCDSSIPLQTENHTMHPGSLSLSDIAKTPNGAQTLEALRHLTAPFNDLNNALAAHYGLLTAPPATAPDGCISDVHEGGMGYHYTRGNNLADDAVSLLDPEFIVYAPTREQPPHRDQVRRQFAALEYFLPFTPRWPAPTDPTFQRAPRLHDFASMANLPDLAFVATPRFGGWMFHIWMWENNPGGEFTNWNRAVPLCQNSSF
jgi:hypothetical protein